VSPTLSLLFALVSLALWLLFGFLLPVSVGAIHLLLALAVILLIRWWALRSRQA
jgi:hypothetical protein